MLDDASVIEQVKTSALSGPRDYEFVGTSGELTSLASSESETASGTMGEGREGIVYALEPTGVAEAWWDKVVARVNNVTSANPNRSAVFILSFLVMTEKSIVSVSCTEPEPRHQHAFYSTSSTVQTCSSRPLPSASRSISLSSSF